MDSIGPTKFIRRAFRQTNVLDLSFVDQFFEGRHGLFDGGGGIHAMHVIQIHIVGPQPLQGF